MLIIKIYLTEKVWFKELIIVMYYIILAWWRSGKMETSVIKNQHNKSKANHPTSASYSEVLNFFTTCNILIILFFWKESCWQNNPRLIVLEMYRAWRNVSYGRKHELPLPDLLTWSQWRVILHTTANDSEYWRGSGKGVKGNCCTKIGNQTCYIGRGRKGR